MLTQLFYTGPSIEVLHERYAKGGVIDDRAPVRAGHEVRIDAPIQRVFDLLCDPSGWSEIEPDIHDVALDSPVVVDARFRWANGKARMSSRFAVLDPGREVTWTGTAPGGAKAVHRHLLEPDSGGGTRLRSEESIAGPLLVLLFPRRKLHAALVRWLGAVKTAAERR
ncbi:MAG: SRPBCC family protein [Pseudonocardia sp.]|nr:SRPBCC family protein [Pseudonocardia sp.]